MEYAIMGKQGSNPAEVVDTFESIKEARAMVQEYRMAFGYGWNLWIKRTRS